MSYLDRQIIAFGKLNNAKIIDSTSNDLFILESNGLLEQLIEIRCGDCSEFIRTCNIHVVFDEAVPEDAYPQNKCVKLTAFVQNYVRNVDGNLVSFDVDLTLRILVPGARKARFLQAIYHGLQITVTGCIESVDRRKINVDEEISYIEQPLEQVHVLWGVGQSERPIWYDQARKQAIWACFENYPLWQQSQVERIYQDFANSFANVEPLKIPTSDEVDSINEVISDVRSSLRPYEKEPGGEDAFGSIWFSEPRYAKTVAAKLPSDEAEKFCKKFDTLWKNFETSRVVKDGESNYGAQHEGFEPKADEIELAAEKLMALSNDHFSETLENVLINALIYTETVEYARYIYSKEKFLGQTVASPLRGLNKDGGKNELGGMGKMIGKTLMEFFSIGLTFVVAYFVTNQDSNSSWTITTGITLYRWLFKLLIELKGDKQQKQIDLALAMMNLHAFTIRPDVNPAIVRQEVIRVSQLGAIFSPAVINLLDRQISRRQKK